MVVVLSGIALLVWGVILEANDAVQYTQKKSRLLTEV